MKEKINIENTHLRENPFTVPDGYFKSMPESVSEKINTPAIIRFKRGYVIISSVAAALVLVFGTFSIMYYGEKNLNIANEEFVKAQEEALSGNINNLSSEEIIDYLTHENVDVATISLID